MNYSLASSFRVLPLVLLLRFTNTLTGQRAGGSAIANCQHAVHYGVAESGGELMRFIECCLINKSVLFPNDDVGHEPSFYLATIAESEDLGWELRGGMDRLFNG